MSERETSLLQIPPISTLSNSLIQASNMNGDGGCSRAFPGLARDHKLVPHVCSFCHRAFASLQSLGGHMTTHRREMDDLRRQHEAFMASQHLRLGPSQAVAQMQLPRQHRPGRQLQQLGHREQQRGIQMVPLTPNHAFWEAYRKAGLCPPVFNFMGVVELDAAVARGLVERSRCPYQFVGSSDQETLRGCWRREEDGEDGAES